MLLASVGEVLKMDHHPDVGPRRAVLPPIESYILTLATVVAGRETGFASEPLRKMAGVGVAHFKSDIHNALLCLS